MATWLRQSTAVDIALGPFVDSTDGFTPETALSLTQAECRLKKNNGSWAQKNDSTTGVHEEEGWYEIELDSTDTNTLGILIVAVYVAGALPVWREFLVVPANVYDSFLSSDLLQVDVTQVGGTTQTAGDIIGDTNDIQARLPAALVSGRIDASVGAMAAGTITAAAIATGAIDADALASDAVAEIADGVWDEALSGHQTGGSAGRSLTLAGSILGEFTLTGTPTSTVIRLTGGSAVNDYYNDMAVMITSGALIGQTRPVLDYDGATGDITVDEPFTSAPASGVTVAILAQHTHPISQIADSVWDEGTSGHVTVGTFGAAIQSISAASIATAVTQAVIEGGLTLEQVLRIVLSAASGDSFFPTPGQIAYRDVANTKNRILANVNAGARSGVVRDGT